jgi:Transposase DDE domain
MSHQDRDGHTVSSYNFQALQDAMQWLLPSASVFSIGFRADCTWSVLGLVYTALLWVWSDQDTITGRFATARKICIKVLGRLARGQGGKVLATSYQAFMKMLRNWTPRLVLEVSTVFRQRMSQTWGDRFTIAGFIPFGVDGSRLELSRTESNEKRFSPKSARKLRRSKGAKRRKPASRNERAEESRRKKTNSPQMWLTTMWHVMTGLPWDWRTGPSDSSEREHALQMVAFLPAMALVVADAGFVGYLFWKTLLESNRHFLVRVGGNVRLLKDLGYVRQKRDIVYVWPDQMAAAHQPPLVLRLVVVNDGKKTWYLVTSVLDHKRLSDKQLGEFYSLRWGIEVFYRSFKQTFARRKLLSDSAENAQVEAQWSLLGLWAMAFHAQHVLAQKQVPAKRVSIARVLRAFRQAMREYKSRPDAGESLIEQLQSAVIDDYKRGCKTSRAYPRKKQETAAGPPKIFYATDKQIHLARQIKEKLHVGLTA